MITRLQPAAAADKVMELRSALFYSASRSLLKIHNQVIHVLFTDEKGHIWFCVPFMHSCLNGMDREFHANLDFFKKGKGFYLKISGKAIIVDDPEELCNGQVISPEAEQIAGAKKTLLVKLQIKEAMYFATETPKRIYPFERWKERFYTWVAKGQKINMKKAFSGVWTGLRYPRGFYKQY